MIGVFGIVSLVVHFLMSDTVIIILLLVLSLIAVISFIFTGGMHGNDD